MKGALIGAYCVAGALGLAACGSSGTQAGSRPPTTVIQALAAVNDSSTARSYFEWSDLRVVRHLAGLPSRASASRDVSPNEHWYRVWGIGASNFAQAEPAITPRTGIDLFAADAAIQIGQPPNTATRIFGPGVQVGAITRGLVSLGAKRERIHGRTFLAIGAEHSVHFFARDPFGVLSGLSQQLNRSVAQDHSFATGGATLPVDAILGGGRSLASDPSYKAAASCLGDVVAAVLGPPGALGVHSSAALVAIGDRRPVSASAPVTEVLCIVDTTPTSTGPQIARLRAALSPHTPEYGGIRYGLYVDSVTVGRADANGRPVVRAVITLRANVPAGYLFGLMFRRELGPLVAG